MVSSEEFDWGRLAEVGDVPGLPSYEGQEEGLRGAIAQASGAKAHFEKEELENLRRSEPKDGLTGLFDSRRQTTREVIDVLLGEAARFNHRVYFMMFDLDHFKAVNDAYGHPVGDEIIKAFAEALRRGVTRQEDLPLRLGGEEFGLIWTAEDEEERATAFEKIFGRVQHHFRELLKERRKIIEEKVVGGQIIPEEFWSARTFSAGAVPFRKIPVTVRTKDGESREVFRLESYEAVYALVDAALLQAKNTGRNRLVIGH